MLPLQKSTRDADHRPMTQIVHRCGAALQFVAWISLWVLLASAVIR